MSPDTPEVAAVDSLMGLLAERDAEIASLKEQCTKLIADRDAVLKHNALAAHAIARRLYTALLGVYRKSFVDGFLLGGEVPDWLTEEAAP